MTLVDLLDELDGRARREHAARFGGKTRQMPVARDKRVCIRLLHQRDQIVVGGIGRDARWRGDVSDRDPVAVEAGEQSFQLACPQSVTQLVATEDPRQLFLDQWRHDDFACTLPPQLDQPERSPARGEKCRDEDVRVDDEPKHLSGGRAALPTDSAHLFDGDPVCLVGIEVVALRDAAEQVDRRIRPERLLHNLGVAPPAARCAHPNRAHHVLVDVDRGLHLRHVHELYHGDVMKERR